MRGWRRILWRTWRGLHRDSLPTVARGIAFSVVMALPPGLAAFVSLYGLIADASKARDHLALLSGVVPASALALVGDEMLRIATGAGAGLGITFFVGLGVAIWTANTGMKALFRGLNIAYQQVERRSAFGVNVAATALTLSAFALLLVATSALLVLPLALERLPKLTALSTVSGLRWPVLFGLAVAACETLYRFGPSRPLARWRWISVGSALTAAAWLIGSALFAWYIRTFSGFSATYGSLGAIFAILISSWLTALVILLGAKLNVEIERQIVREPTLRSVSLGRRRPRSRSEAAPY